MFFQTKRKLYILDTCFYNYVFCMKSGETCGFILIKNRSLLKKLRFLNVFMTSERLFRYFPVRELPLKLLSHLRAPLH